MSPLPKPNQLPNTFYLSLVTVDAASSVPLYRQIYAGLRDAITDGRLAADTRLPSTRDLAAIWQVSRNTLRNAFDQLVAEGYVDTLVGHGTFVLPLEPRLLSHPAENKAPKLERIRPISVLGQHLEPIGKGLNQPSPPGSAFAVGVPDTSSFPHQVWNRIVNRVQRQTPAGTTIGFNISGQRVLREAIASYLISARGLRCSAEQIDIVPSSVTGIMLASLALLNRGDKFWMEEPGYISASAVLRYRGAEMVPLPVDVHGLDVSAGIKQAPDARVAYVTPSHQYPLGVTLSLARRQLLLDWAAQNSAWIFEDDYDSEFRYDGPPLTALQGLDAHDRVIYFGTFSKILFPDLRLSYVVLPDDLVDVYRGVKAPMAMYGSSLLQRAVAEFMLEGHFVRHIRRMRQHYKARRDALVEAVEHYLPNTLTLGATECGMHAVGYLADGLDEARIVSLARQQGMVLAPLTSFYVSGGRPGLVFGFANVAPKEIDRYIRQLRDIMHL